jgi:hypothetical protein
VAHRTGELGIRGFGGLLLIPRAILRIMIRNGGGSGCQTSQFSTLTYTCIFTCTFTTPTHYPTYLQLVPSHRRTPMPSNCSPPWRAFAYPVFEFRTLTHVNYLGKIVRPSAIGLCPWTAPRHPLIATGIQAKDHNHDARPGEENTP